MQTEKEKKAYAREYYLKNKDRITRYAKAHHTRNIIHNHKLGRIGNLRRRFGLTLKEYEKMLTKQGGVCAICKNPETTISRGKVLLLAVDHCHATGKIRGLLCVSCNSGLAQFRDNVDRLIDAANYLIEYKDVLLKLVS